MKRLLALLALLPLACSAPHRAAAAPTPADWPTIAVDLGRRVEADQAMREELMKAEEITPDLVHRLSAVDEDNTSWLKALIDAHGWPTFALVGEKAAGDAWLLAQHADHDVAFQEQCLALLRDAVAAGQADRRHLAYLDDRVAMHHGRPQRHGTQFVQKGDKLEPYTLEDPARVDEWRAEAGLGTLEEYEEQLRDGQ